ncbi:SfnB family sulfur acquisition oxidoreductase [Pseudomonas matsuisoli]|uniref:SfnB family sulfur acquisition oxidoreductase n=1 Tax=Pseudomonas matsuisoli TaxID=1515666 RepID=A0A917PVI9_9PSED|nr:SfnB family sulfur acquisition oxidoreductase [Pseudomonas matsuisoli]GGJ93869.1 SfnB family sulfur acquisition oxidoreductase [Pseudomonas matsuisoli]
MTASLNVTPRQTAAILDNDAQALATVEALAADFAKDAIARDRDRRLPFAELDRLAASGLLAITVPREFGGADVSSATLAKVIARLAAADGSLGQIPQNHFYALEVLRVNGTRAQQERLFAEALSGVRFGNALAEIGTKTSQIRTTSITPDGNGYRINGRKFYSTGALYAQRIPTGVMAEDGKQYMAFAKRDTEGLTIIDDWSGFGQRTTGSGSVVFENVYVDADDVVPFQASFERPTRVGPFAQILHAAIDTGIARGAYDDAVHFVRHHARPWPDSGIEKASDDPLTISEIGRLAIRLHAAEALLERAGAHLDIARGAPDAHSVAAASLAVAEARALSTEVSLAAGSKLIELGGARASLAEHGLDRHWRNARTHTLHDPVRWKYHAIGNYYLNDVLPPRKGYI